MMIGKKVPITSSLASLCLLLDLIASNSPQAQFSIAILTFALMLMPPNCAVTSESLHGLFPLIAMLFLHGPAWLTPSPPPGRPSLILTVEYQLLHFGTSCPLTLVCSFHCTDHSPKILHFTCMLVYCLSSPDWILNSTKSGAWSIFFRF